MRIAQIFWSLLLLSATVQGQTDEPAIVLNITEPENGVIYSRDVTLRGTLSTPPGREYEVKVRCFEMTHWLLCTPKRPFPPKTNAKGRVKWHLWDDYFLPLSGDQVMEIEVFELRNGAPVDPNTPVARTEVPFRFVPATKEELVEDLAGRSRMICGEGLSLAKGLLDPRSPYLTLEKLDQKGGEMSSEGLSYVTRRHYDFWSRTNGYGMAAYHLDRAGHPGDALRALRTAEEIYNLEKNALLSGPGFQNWPIIWKNTYSSDPPAFFREYSYYYARRNELDQAVHWQKERAGFYLRQASGHPLFRPVTREKCRTDAARCYQQIGRLHYLLKRDRAEWDAWMRKYEQALPASASERRS